METIEQIYIMQVAHQELMQKATEALNNRGYFAAYPEHPKAYPEDGVAKAQEWFMALEGNKYSELLQEGEHDWKGDEVSPYTQATLEIKYPYFDPETLINRAKETMRTWRRTSVEERVSILLDSLDRIRTRFFDIAIATMHTTGQSWMMSFQASGPHANDRALEAIAIAFEEMKRYPAEAEWEKPMGRMNIKLRKSWLPIGRGIGLVIGCSTFPVWNTVPGLFASLVTGNPVIVKPHPGAILPIAIVVGEIQKALLQHGYNPNIVQLAPDTNSDPIAKILAENQEVKIIDYTGGTHFGNYIENLPGKVAFTEKAGVNSVILDSFTDIDLAMDNLAFAVSLYSGQMCTAPQNFFIPENGVKVGEETWTFDQVAGKFVERLKLLLENPKMAAGTLGAIQNINTLQRIVDAKTLAGHLLLDSIAVANPEYPHARIASPIVLTLNADQREIFGHELFGPIVLLIKTKNIEQSVQLAKELALKKGAISCGAYTTHHNTMRYISEEMEEAFTPVAFNLTGPIWMNQNAAFSDFHVTGGNPAGNATFTDSAYISRRFAWVGHKMAV